MFLFCLILFIVFVIGFMYLFYQIKLLKDEFEEVYDTIYKYFNMKGNISND